MVPGSSEDLHLPSVGDRVADGNDFRATVRYVGPVCTAKDPTAPWIGEPFSPSLTLCVSYVLKQ